MKLVRALAFAVAAFATSPSFATEPVQWNGWSDDCFPARRPNNVSSSSISKRCGAIGACDGKDHLRRPRSHRIIGLEIYCGAGGPGRQSRSLEPLRRWGWPATIVFAPDGTEIAKIRGYIEPSRMQALLKAIIDDPSPGPSVGEAFQIKPSASVFLTREQRAELVATVDKSYEDNIGGWAESQKNIHSDSMDYAIPAPRRATKSRPNARGRPSTPRSH